MFIDSLFYAIWLDKKLYQHGEIEVGEFTYREYEISTIYHFTYPLGVGTTASSSIVFFKHALAIGESMEI